MSKFNPKYKVTVRWYTFLVIALIIALFVIGYVTNKNDELVNPPSDEADKSICFSSADLSSELTKQGLTLDNQMLSDSSDSDWGKLLIVNGENEINELRFETGVFPLSGSGDEGVVAERIQSLSKTSIERIESFLAACRKSLINGGLINNSSAKRTNTVLDEIKKVINSAEDYVWVWGDYTYRAERIEADEGYILIIQAQFEG